MKYIIDVPEEVKWIQGIKQTGFGTQAYGLVPVKDLKPYTEPDSNAIKIAQEEAWKFANNISRRMSIGQREACFGYSLISGVLDALTYQEAKDKYEAYEKKDVLKIQLYDELLNDDGNKGVVVGENDDYYTVLWWNGSCGILYKNSDDFKKSGKRHPEIADLLKQLRK